MITILLLVIDSTFQWLEKYAGLKILNLRYIMMQSCKSSIWHPHISLYIKNIESIMERKLIQSEISDVIGVLKFCSS